METDGISVGEAGTHEVLNRKDALRLIPLFTLQIAKFPAGVRNK